MAGGVLAAIDLASGSKPVASYGVTLARALGAELVLLHVISPEEEESRARNPGESRFVDVMIEETEAALRSLAGEAGAGHLDVRCVARVGQPVDEIIATAGGFDGPLVVGMRRRSRVGKFLLGSHLQEILVASAGPVVTVPIHPEAG